MFYFDKNFGLFVGELPENKFHKHYAIQISVSLISEMLLFVNNEKTSGKTFFINSRVEHKLLSKSSQLTILINPLSTIGHYLYLDKQNILFSILNNKLSQNLTKVLKKFQSQKITFDAFCNMISDILYSCEAENHFQDDRIIKAIKYMDDNFERVLSLDEVSAHCFLSSTRFLHLFKEKTNLSFRRYQLWNKIVKSLPYLKEMSITETAHTSGFSDSAHYTRTFKETFGVTPKFLLRKE